MENDELYQIVKQVFAIVTGMFEIQGKHDAVLSGLLQNYSNFLASLNGTIEPKGSPGPESEQAAALRRRAQSEIEELEKLFRREPPPTI